MTAFPFGLSQLQLVLTTSLANQHIFLLIVAPSNDSSECDMRKLIRVLASLSGGQRKLCKRLTVLPHTQETPTSSAPLAVSANRMPAQQ